MENGRFYRNDEIKAINEEVQVNYAIVFFVGCICGFGVFAIGVLIYQRML